jgi:ribose 5-phosphate isomerase A
MTIGLGSGRAVAAVIELAARRWPSGPPLLAVVASSATDSLARAAGFAVVSLDELDLKRRDPDGPDPDDPDPDGPVGDPGLPALLDLAVDGADEVDPRLDLVKGGGGALLREKLVARAASCFLIVVEDDKVVARLGEHHALPVEIVRFGWRETRRSLLDLVPAARLRRGGDGQAFVTDEGHFILDCTLEGDRTPEVDRAPEVDRGLENRREESGVVDHGLFLGMADEVVIGRADGSVERRLRGAR